MVREIYAAILPTQGLARTMPTGWGLPKASRRPNENALVSSVSLSKRLWADPLDPLFVWNQFPAEREWPARGPAADQGVRPSVPSMGRIYRDERIWTELMTTTVAKRKAQPFILFIRRGRKKRVANLRP